MVGFFHAGVTCSDLERSLRFYRDALGLEVEKRWQRRGEDVAGVLGLQLERLDAAMLRVPGSDARVELFEYHGIERHPASCRPCDYGAGHFCVYVDDAEALYARLLELGFSARGPVVSIDSGPHAGAKAVYTIDPDGYHVELYERPPEAA